MSIARVHASSLFALQTAGVLLIAASLAPSPARADCGSDLGALMNKRMASITLLNRNTKAHGGKLDPISACPQLRNLAATEGNVLAYMAKNKDWCSIPDDLVSKMTQSRVKTADVAAKACQFAVKIKQMQAQAQARAKAGAVAQQQEQAIRLPSGPL